MSEEEEEEGPAIDVHRKKFVYKVQPAQSIPSTSTIHSALTSFKSSSSSEEYLAKTRTATIALAGDATAEGILLSSICEPQSERHSAVDAEICGRPEPLAEQGDWSVWKSEQDPEQRGVGEGEQQQAVHFNEDLIMQNAVAADDVQPDSDAAWKAIEEGDALVSDGNDVAAEMAGGQDVAATFTLKMNADGSCEGVKYEEKTSEEFAQGAPDSVAEVVQGALDPVGEDVQGALDPVGEVVQGALDPVGEVVQGALDQVAGTQHGELFGHAAALLNQPDEISLSHEGRRDHPSTVVNGLTSDGQCLNGGLVDHFYKNDAESEEKRVNIQDNKCVNPLSPNSERLPRDEKSVPGSTSADSEILSSLTADQTKIFVGLSETDSRPPIAPEQDISFVIEGLTHDGNAIITGLSVSESCRAPSAFPVPEAPVPVIAGLTEDNNFVLCSYATSMCLQNVQPSSIIMNLTLDKEVVLSGLAETLTENSTTVATEPGAEPQQTEMPVNEVCRTTETTADNNSSPEQEPPTDESPLIRRDSF